MGSLDAFKKNDLAVIAKPTEGFTEEEKQVLDQYIINGANHVADRSSGRQRWIAFTMLAVPH
jgi:hypothetical protein